jgi:WD40 repeat protein
MFLSAAWLLGAGANLLADGGPDIVWITNGHSAIVSSAAFSSDSARLASGSPDQYAKVWSVTPAALIRVIHLSDQESISSVSLSSDGSKMATGGDEGRTRVWNVSNGTLVWGVHDSFRSVMAIAFSPQDVNLASGLTDTGLLLATANGQSGDYLNNQQGDVRGVAFSPNNALVASASTDAQARIFRVTQRDLLFTLPHDLEVNSVDFSPDGKLLATCSADGTARLWNVTNGESVLIIDGGGGIGKFSADGKYLFTLHLGTFKIWRVSGGAYVGSITNTGATTFDIAKNGKYFAFGTGSGAVVLARMPVIVDEVSRMGNQTVLKWQGGSGLYQLQSRTNFTNDPWQNIGSSTTNTIATNLTSSTLFFRVQSLPNP